jgi:Fic family protein
MNASQKLQLIQQISGLTQESLARELHVTFATLNSWMRERSTPRKGSIRSIDSFYYKLTGQEPIISSALDSKKSIIRLKSKEHKGVLRQILSNPDIHDQFMLSLTYHTNRIEGSTLTEHETEAILFQNASIPNKTLVEQLEVKNHQTALEYLFQHLVDRKKIDECLLLKLHSILMNSIRPDAGTYRSHSVRIVGSNVPTANHVKVPALMGKLFSDIRKRGTDVIAKVSQIHSRFEQIHPFSDGNGRVGRLFIHAMLLIENVAPAVIRLRKKRHYMEGLNKSQRSGDYMQLEDCMCDAVLDGFRILERKRSGRD